MGVENRIRALLHEDAFDNQPIRFIILDLSKVDGVDFSAAEAFPRINRILNMRDVQMLMSGMSLNGGISKILYKVGLLREDDGVEVFEDLNSALEFCENDLLKTLYQHGEPVSSPEPSTIVIGMWSRYQPFEKLFTCTQIFRAQRRRNFREKAL